MSVLTSRVLLGDILGLDQEGVGTEVVTLSLKQVGGQVLGAVTVEESQSSAESRSGDASLDRPGNDVSPAFLSGVDGLVEEIVEQKVLEVRVGTVSGGDVLQEDGANDATTTPHEGNGWLIQLPAVLLSRLYEVSIAAVRFAKQLTVCISMKPWAYEMILEAYSACSRLSRNA